MKKFTLLLAGLAISASAFAQTAGETTYGFLFGSATSNLAVFKSGYTISYNRTDGKVMTFQVLNGGNDGAFSLIGSEGDADDSNAISAVHVKWHDAAGTAQIVFRFNDNLAYYYKLGEEPGESTIEINSVRESAEKFQAITSLLNLQLTLQPDSKAAIDELYLIQKDGTKIPARYPRNNNTYELTKDYVAAPCTFSIYQKNKSLEIYTRTGDATQEALSIPAEKNYRVTVEIDPELTVGNYQILSGSTVLADNLDNTKSTWEFTTGNTAYSPVAIRMVSDLESATSPMWLTVKKITVADADSSALDDITVTTTDDGAVIYDLQGRALGTDIHTLGHGLYIRNGKKFVK